MQIYVHLIHEEQHLHCRDMANQDTMSLVEPRANDLLFFDGSLSKVHTNEQEVEMNSTLCDKQTPRIPNFNMSLLPKIDN